MIFDYKVSVQQICIITFYSAQVACIRSKLASALHDHHHHIRVMTVDSFQGSENDCVILSFVRSNPRNILGFVNDYQRLNVAITRARFLLVAVGNVETLSRSRGNEGESSNFVSEFVNNATVRRRVFAASELPLSLAVET